jgi:ribosomal protein L34E
MGLFNSIYFECPQCGATIEGQSKGGNPFLETFKKEDVPIDVAAELSIPEKCHQCGRRLGLHSNMPKSISFQIVALP